MQLSFGCKRNDWDAEVVHPVVLLQRAYKKALTTA
jgi:hypothetical protein